MKTVDDWNEYIDKVVKKAARAAVAEANYDSDAKIAKAASDAVAFYDEANGLRFGQVMEAIESMQVLVAKIPKLGEDIAGLKSDMKTVKKALKDTNDDLRNLGKNW